MLKLLNKPTDYDTISVDKIKGIAMHYGILFISPLTPVVRRVDSAIHWINHYPLDNTIGFASAYPLDSDLSGG